MQTSLFALLVVAVLALPALAQSPPEPEQLALPGECCTWMVNQDGSCVQCSLAMCGLHQNCPQATTLLFDSPYGPRVRGGSGPSRVEAYAERRSIPCYNVTGSNTWEWMKWGAKTGRLAAIGCFGRHFQTLLWFNPDPADPKPWKVRNNWHGTTAKTAEYTESEFRRHHLASGQWVVILKLPPPPPGPVYVAWWK